MVAVVVTFINDKSHSMEEKKDIRVSDTARKDELNRHLSLLSAMGKDALKKMEQKLKEKEKGREVSEGK